MEATTATVIGAAIGASAGILGALVTGLLQSRSATGSWERSRKDQFENNLRSAVQNLTQHVSSALHSMCWLTWLAAERPDRIKQTRIDAYDFEIHRITPKINGSLGSVAAIDEKIFLALKGQVDQVLGLDWEIGTAALQFDRNREESARLLANLHDRVNHMHQQLPDMFGSILRRRLAGEQHLILR